MGAIVNNSLISQYANSPVILQLLTNFEQYIDPSTKFDQFYNSVWNIDTATGYGLDVWGRIVGVGRVLALQSGTYFGFGEENTPPAAVSTFGFGQFYNGVLATSSFALSDTAYRKLILAKALANISNGTIPALNQMLINLFPYFGNCYVIDTGNMSMTYHFSTTLDPVSLAIVSQSGVLPTPTGVAVV